MTPAARISAAIDLLAAVDAAPRRPADATANAFFRDRRYIGSGDRRAVSDRTWRVIRARRRLRWWGGTTPRSLVAASLLLEGWAWEAVNRTFSGGQFAPSNLTPDERRALQPLEGHTLDHPDMPEAVRYEVPDWVLPSLRARFGPDLPAEMAALSEPAPLDLRVNLLKATREEAVAALAAEGIAAEPTPLSPCGLRVAARTLVTSGPAFQSGTVEIQDEGSQLVAALTDARPGMRVADWCAGAGGKTLALATSMQNRGHIAACDVSAPRLDAAVKRLRRAGVHNVESHLVTEGDKWRKRRAGTFDRVLVDAPCTGAGTWRRNPDARSRLTEQDLAELLVKQAHILVNAATLVRTGGRLVYATCSLLPEENEQQVSRFLENHPEFSPIAPRQAWPDAPDAAAFASPDWLRLTPLRDGTDGFFAAVLERRAAAPEPAA